MTARQWAFVAFHSLHDELEEREQAWEREKQAHLMALLIEHKPEDALAILQGKRPESAPPEDGPVDERTFLRTDLYFHAIPSSVQNGNGRSMR